MKSPPQSIIPRSDTIPSNINPSAFNQYFFLNSPLSARKKKNSKGISVVTRVICESRVASADTSKKASIFSFLLSMK